MAGAPDPKPSGRVRDADAVRLARLDGHACVACKAPGESVHHVLAKGERGDDVPGNLVVLCGDGARGCHGAFHGSAYVVGGERRDRAWVAARVGAHLFGGRPDVLRYLVGKLGYVAGLDFAARVYLTHARAVFDETREYRYTLERDIEPRLGGVGARVAFVCLNPSKADERINDPTVTRMMGYASRWGYTRLTVANVYAFRSTDPAALRMHPDPVGADNDFWIAAACEDADLVVCAWGALAGARGRAVYVLLRDAGVEPRALAVTAAGQPSHPLYLKASLRPVPYVLPPA